MCSIRRLKHTHGPPPNALDAPPLWQRLTLDHKHSSTRAGACLAVEVDAAQHFGRFGASLEGRECEGGHQRPHNVVLRKVGPSCVEPVWKSAFFRTSGTCFVPAKVRAMDNGVKKLEIQFQALLLQACWGFELASRPHPSAAFQLFTASLTVMPGVSGETLSLRSSSSPCGPQRDLRRFHAAPRRVLTTSREWPGLVHYSTRSQGMP